MNLSGNVKAANTLAFTNCIRCIVQFIEFQTYVSLTSKGPLKASTGLYITPDDNYKPSSLAICNNNDMKLLCLIVALLSYQDLGVECQGSIPVKKCETFNDCPNYQRCCEGTCVYYWDKKCPCEENQDCAFLYGNGIPYEKLICCEDGTCKKSIKDCPQPNLDCKTDLDCPKGMICCNGKCVKAEDCPCKTDQDCPKGEQCCWYNGEKHGICQEDCPCKCKSDFDCQKGTICCQGKCLAPEDCEDKPCKSYKDCPKGTRCCNGTCVNPKKCPCKEDPDCTFTWINPLGWGQSVKWECCADGICKPKCKSIVTKPPSDVRG